MDTVETHAYWYGTRKDLVCKKEEITRSSMIKNTKMINFDDVTKENIKEHNSRWRRISDYPYRIFIIGGSGPGKTNLLFNLIIYQPDTHKIHLYAQDSYKTKY